MNPFQKKKNKNYSGQAKNKFWITSLFDAILLLINFIIIGFLFLGDAACYISPAKLLLPAYFGLAFPVLIILNIIFLVFWIIRFKWYFVISLTALLISYQSIYNTFPVNREKKIPESHTPIKILSYNVHLFDFYTPASKNKILDYIADSEADILCLQEFGFSSLLKKDYLKKSEILEKLQKKYPYYHIGLTSLRENSSYGVATFSKFPIIKKERMPIESKFNSAIYSDVRINNKVVRIFNCHLESNNLTENDKVLIRGLSGEFSNEKVNEVVDNLSRKLGYSFKLRATQAEIIADEIARTETPIILCGDFNDVPVSYAYSTIKGSRLLDSFTECGNGYGYTFNEKLFWFRIDQIMHSQEFQAVKFEVDKVRYSDHFPIKCQMILKEN